MLGKKKSTDKAKGKDEGDMKIKLDSLEMESVADQLREIEERKKKDKKKS